MNHAHKGGLDVRRQLGQTLHRRLMEDVADQIEAALGLVANDVGEVHDAHRRTAVHHRQVVDIVAQHAQHRLLHRLVGLHRDQAATGDLAHRGIRRQPFGHHLGAKVAVGQDPGDLPVATFTVLEGVARVVLWLVQHQHRRCLGLADLAGGLLHRGPRLDHDGVAAQQLANPRHHHVVVLALTFHRRLEPRTIHLDELGKLLVGLA